MNASTSDKLGDGVGEAGLDFPYFSNFLDLSNGGSGVGRESGVESHGFEDFVIGAPGAALRALTDRQVEGVEEVVRDGDGGVDVEGRADEGVEFALLD
jgi:hypothetical protein